LYIKIVNIRIGGEVIWKDSG